MTNCCIQSIPPEELDQFYFESLAKISMAGCAELKEMYPKTLATVIVAKGGQVNGCDV